MRISLSKKNIIDMMNEDGQWQKNIIDYTCDINGKRLYYIKYDAEYYGEDNSICMTEWNFITYLVSLLSKKGYMNIYLEPLNNGGFKLTCSEIGQGRRRRKR